jgi:inosose dehydratase
VDALRGRLDTSGLTLVMLDAKCDITAADHAEVLAAQLDRCAALSCPIFFLSVKAGEMDRAKVYSRLRRLGDEADRRDLTVVLETHPDLLTNSRVALETITAVDHPRVRINFDPANICYYNDGLDPIAELRTILAFVHGVHLKDSVGRIGEWNFPPLGQGVIDYPALFSTLDKHGFDGPYSMELEGVEGTTQTADEVKREVEQSIEYLRRIGAMRSH